jgi:hypothetical protein
MTEVEWLACTDPKPMLEFVAGKTSDRKLRLFACACVRRVWGLLENELSQDSIVVSERYADGLANREELAEASSNALGVHYNDVWPGWDEEPAVPPDEVWHSKHEAIQAAYLASHEEAEDAARYASSYARDAVGDAEPKGQANLLREIFGNPFLPVALHAWRTPTVGALATAASEERILPAGHLDATRLSVLADALEEIGCEAAILGHLRNPGFHHVRGCWVVDALLGKS